VIGVSSFDTAHRGYIDAFDAKTGKHAWRFWAIPGPGAAGHDTWPADLWKLGTSSTWLTGSFDASLNLIYWPVGNPGPMIGGSYAGRKLYSDSVVALDADTGKLKWFFQDIPNDKFDFDALEPILFEARIDGKVRELLIQPNKGGFAYVLDRASGAFMRAFRFADAMNWTTGLDAAGRPLEPRLSLGLGEDKLECPGVYGARAIGHSSYSPLTHLWYNSSYETCTHQVGVAPRAPQEGLLFNASMYSDTRIASNSHPSIAAFDPVTGRREWVYPTNSVNLSSLLSTAGNLLFGGDIFGNAFALDAANGRQLWSFNVGTGISSAPISFAVGGRQYISVAAGLSPVAAALANDVLSDEEKAHLPPVGSLLVTFALPETPSAAP
jgi:alcohol dehydrogenase (cytochrome c)